jgi:hypothetical protein
VLWAQSKAAAPVAPIAMSTAPVGENDCVPNDPALAIPLADTEMISLCDGIYVEPGLTNEQVAEVRGFAEEAHRNVARLFDSEVRSSPFVLFCKTAACKIEFGASPESAKASDLGFARDVVKTKSGPYAHSIVVVSTPYAGATRLLTHELVHAEMKAWVPYDDLPTWFNEGMATFVANEPNCDQFPPAEAPDVSRLDSKAAWEKHLAEHHDTRAVYCQSRHQVAKWAARFTDSRQRAAALKTSMLAVRNGSSFERAFAL